MFQGILNGIHELGSKEIISWLLQGDVAIQYQVHRDLLGQEKPSLRKKIATQGWGAALLAKRNSNGHWGRGFYQPKWTSTHYALLELKEMCLPPENKMVRESLRLILQHERGPDRGINPSPNIKESDVCLNGMFLNYAAYFGANEKELEPIVDFILLQHMADGGFNCRYNRSGATHSSVHSTLSVLEGFCEYEKNGYTYKLSEIKKVAKAAREFLLVHHLFRSHTTGKIIDQRFVQFHYPCRWYYDVLKALDHFRHAGTKYDARMEEALNLVLKKRTASGHWKLAAKYPGQTHFDMEKPGQPSRWNTLRAIRVIQYFIQKKR